MAKSISGFQRLYFHHLSSKPIPNSRTFTSDISATALFCKRSYSVPKPTTSQNHILSQFPKFSTTPITISPSRHLISVKAFSTSKFSVGFAESLANKPLSVAKSAIGLLREAFCKGNYLILVGAGGVVVCIALWRPIFGVATTFVGLSHGTAKYGFLALAASLVAFAAEVFRGLEAAFGSPFSSIVGISGPSGVGKDAIIKAEAFRGLEAALGSPFSSEPLSPPPKPLIIVISGPSGVGKDAVIKRLREVREGIHFVVTATSREKRPGEVHGKDYYFVTKEDFLSMIERNELLEYALVYGDYKGIPKQQIREFMAKGFDIVLRVDIQGAATLRSILGDSAVFIFLVAESEAALVKRLIDRKTETSEMLLVRIATAREEVRHMKLFDYVVVNAEGKLEESVQLVNSIIDAEKARVHPRFVKIE